MSQKPLRNQTESMKSYFWPGHFNTSLDSRGKTPGKVTLVPCFVLDPNMHQYQATRTQGILLHPWKEHNAVF